MDIAGQWKIAYTYDSKKGWITPEEGEDMHTYLIVFSFEIDGSLLMLIPMDREFSKEEIAVMSEEMLVDFENQGLYDRRHPNMIVTDRSSWKSEGGKNYVHTSGEDDYFVSSETLARFKRTGNEWTEVAEEGEYILPRGDIKLVRVTE
ncbi:MAG: hypothetical protein J6M17_11955 [Ruminococcus sp.]|nr:hypothetical protein [Ruminococcus sp.]